jgi:diguanylate cyclase (GGDEF)-like protein
LTGINPRAAPGRHIPSMPSRALLPLTARHHPPLLGRRRAQAILARVRIFAALFAALTVAWIAVDAMTIGPPRSGKLAIARLVAGTLFASLAWHAHTARATLLRARLCLLALFSIPVGFFVTAQSILAGAQLGGVAQGVAAAYSFVPFLLAGGIASFPLAVSESLLLAVLPFAAQGWLLEARGLLSGVEALDAFWLLSLMVAMATFAAASQLWLMSQLVGEAMRDPLTGCLRRDSGTELLDMQLAFAIRHRQPFAVLFADIDRFKRINDGFGHERGDQVLAATAAALRAVLRESDTLLRWGGEEFVVALPATTAEQAGRLIERLRPHCVGNHAQHRHRGVSRRPARRRRGAGGARRRAHVPRQAGRAQPLRTRRSRAGGADPPRDGCLGIVVE